MRASRRASRAAQRRHSPGGGGNGETRPCGRWLRDRAYPSCTFSLQSTTRPLRSRRAPMLYPNRSAQFSQTRDFSRRRSLCPSQSRFAKPSPQRLKNLCNMPSPQSSRKPGDEHPRTGVPHLAADTRRSFHGKRAQAVCRLAGSHCGSPTGVKP
jgi:hypothetical protein